jgi:hypothetical protein
VRREQAGDFFEKLGLDEKLSGLILAVIGNGSQLAYQIDVRRGGEPAESAMKAFAVRVFGEFLGKPEVSDRQAEGFAQMCRMLQLCDGGAYTSMAVTHSKQLGTWYRNAPTFNSSFKQPSGFGRRGISARQPADSAAARDLTPKVAVLTETSDDPSIIRK